MIANGTNWEIIAGEPKREQKYEAKSYTKAELEAGVEPNSTRPIVVNVIQNNTEEIVSGGVVINFNAGSNTYLPVWVNPGQKLKIKTSSVSVTLQWMPL